MIAIIDYGVGNLFSLSSSLKHIGADAVVTSDKTKIKAADKIILPGVGAFTDAAKALKESGLGELVVAEARAEKPLLGICLGMQMLYEKSYEHGEHEGLGLLSGTVESLSAHLEDESLKVPHMGWNHLTWDKEKHPLLQNIEENRAFYYVHSFFAPISEDTVAYSNYGNVKVTGVCARDKIMGTQFHPEKSGEVGLNLLRTFVEM